MRTAVTKKWTWYRGLRKAQRVSRPGSTLLILYACGKRITCRVRVSAVLQGCWCWGLYNCCEAESGSCTALLTRGVLVGFSRQQMGSIHLLPQQRHVLQSIVEGLAQARHGSQSTTSGSMLHSWRITGCIYIHICST